MTTLSINKELNGIEVIFESKPAQEIIDSLKNNGFRWHRVKKLWYAKNTAERLALAETIVNRKAEATKKETKKAVALSLWERCKTECIPEHDRHTDTKTVAAETRKHIKERFPEIKFSCRIGSGGWAAYNEVNFEFKSAPFAKDSIYFEAVKKYVEAWLWSFNYDNSDSMTDYFDRNFYEFIRADYDFEEKEPTEAQKADLANFDEESRKAKEEEERRQEEKYKKYLAEQEEKEKAWKERQKIEEAQKAEISGHVKVVDIEENKKYIVSDSMICGHGKENSIKELQEDGTEKEESALVKRELYFTDEKIYNNFCNLFLHDFDFLNGCGGTGTLDSRVSDENIHQLNSRQRESVKWILWDCVAVFLNGELKLVIDPEGYSYARYVNAVSGEYTKTLLHDEEHQEEQTNREEFYIPAPIAEQAQSLEVGKDYTLIYIDPWTMTATMHHITVSDKDVRQYAQYKDALYLEYTEKGKRKAQYQYFHNGSNILLYSGFLPAVPTEIIQRKISENMYQVRNAGMTADDFMIDVYRHYKDNGYKPVINTLQF